MAKEKPSRHIGVLTPEQEQAMHAEVVKDRAGKEIEALQMDEAKKEMQSMEKKKIGTDEIIKASQILQKYKSGKANLEAKIIANEEYWKLRQWQKKERDNSDYIPTTAWLWSCIQSRHSDIMDSYPTCNFKPRQGDDKAEAIKLSSIVPVVFEQNRYEDTYSDLAWYMLKQGGCVQGIFWDKRKHNGLGDVSIRKVDFINLFWEPGITDIQDSTHLFYTELVNKDIIEQRYPQTVGKIGGKSVDIAKYLYDDQVDTQDKVVLVDWYYHTEYNGKRTLQYVQFVNDIVLYATENETERPTESTVDPETGIPVIRETGESMAERGLYDHALYPFVVQALYPIEGSICGYGLTDIGRDAQNQIDILNKQITENTIVGAAPRYFIKNDGSVNEEEFMDITKRLVHVAGSLGDENLRPVDTKQLSSVYVDVMNQKIQELKFVTSNQDVNNGVASGGITAASSIAALQESAGKNARETNKSFYRAYREVCYQVIELIRQFYDLPRVFRISPDAMQETFITYNNQGLKAQPQYDMAGNNMGYRLPEFDIEISAEKSNPYKKMEVNELAIQFYNLGFFNPQMSDQALACLNMMDFASKNDVVATVQKNGTLQQMLLQYQQIALQLAQQVNPALAEQIGQSILASGGQPMPSKIGDIDLSVGDSEHPYVENAREQARESTQVVD